LPEAAREHRGDGGRGEEAEHPQHHTGQERRIRAERHADVGIRAAGERHAAPGIGDAEHDERHGRGAHEIGDGRRRTKRAGDVRRQAEDAAAHGDVDDRGSQAERAHDAHEGAGGGGGRVART
jgi:hypothetical protein